MKPFNVANKSLIKDMNTSVILNLVRERGPISRAEISKLTGLNPATVSSNAAALMELGFVREIGTGASSGGRKPLMLELDPGAYQVVGVDMGTTDVSVGLTDLDGSIRFRLTLPFEDKRAPEEILAVIRRAVREVLDGGGVPADRILGIGMGFHGLVDPVRGVSLFAPAFQWENIPIAEPFSEEFGLPVIMDNDVRVMALGEKWFGKAKEVSNFVFLNIGTGIGSGIYVNGELIRGAHFGAGEIGHNRVTDGGEECFCGKKGCLSTLASGPAIERRARSALRQGETSVLHEWAGGDYGSVTGPLIHRAAMMGDKLSVRLLDESGRHIGRVLSQAINLLNPEMVLIGGGVSNAGEFLFAGMREEIGELAMKNNIEKIYIGPAGLGDECGIVGAATQILRNIFSNPNQYKDSI